MKMSRTSSNSVYLADRCAQVGNLKFPDRAFGYTGHFSKCWPKKKKSQTFKFQASESHAH